MAYAIENALFQWEEGEARIRDASGRDAIDLDRAARLVVAELRRRLGGSFTLAELAARHAAGTDAAAVVDAAFARYAREASNFAGGLARESHARP